MQNIYKEVFVSIERSEEWSQVRDSSLPGYEHGTEFSWQLQNNSKKELSCKKKTSCMIGSYSETVINPLP
jgi:hypothetical protein